jgi:hypothetical protein
VIRFSENGSHLLRCLSINTWTQQSSASVDMLSLADGLHRCFDDGPSANDDHWRSPVTASNGSGEMSMNTHDGSCLKPLSTIDASLCVETQRLSLRSDKKCLMRCLRMGREGVLSERFVGGACAHERRTLMGGYMPQVTVRAVPGRESSKMASSGGRFLAQRMSQSICTLAFDNQEASAVGSSSTWRARSNLRAPTLVR